MNMAKVSNELVRFCADNEHTSNFITAFQDYFADYMKSNYNRNIPGLSTGVTNFSLDEKSNKIHEAFMSEIESRSGVERNALNKDSWAVNPNVRWVK